MKAIITIGCSASGKSTYADNLVSEGYLRIERDMHRKSILHKKNKEYDLNHETTNLWKFWNFKWENEVDESINNHIEYAVGAEKNIILSDTNLSKDRREALAKKLQDFGYEVEYHVFGKDLVLDDLWKRDIHRVNSVGFSVIAKQYQQFRKEFPLVTLKCVEDKPDAVIFDVDGTLAHMDGLRDPYNWHKVDIDTPDMEIIPSLIAQHLLGRKIIIMSGRDSICREMTLNWLNYWINHYAKVMLGQPMYPNLITNDNLFMRPEGSQDSDVKVKRELFMEHVDGNYKVVRVFDDRPKVCRGWLDMGLDVVWCGNPYIEF